MHQMIAELKALRTGSKSKRLQGKTLEAPAIIEGMPEAMIIFDLDGKILQVNGEFERGTGWKREEAVGKSPLELGIMSKEEEQRVVKEIIPKLERDGLVRDIALTAIRKDGSTFPILMNWILVKEDPDTPSAIISVARDMTEQKRTEEALRASEQRFRAIFDGMVDGILLADVKNRRFNSGNNMICRMLGYDLKEIKRLEVTDIHPREDLSNVLEQFDRQTKGENPLARDVPVKRKDGSVFYADINSAPILLDGKMYLMGAFRDITERKIMEEELRETYRHLRELQDQLVQSEKMGAIGKLASGIAHELRNPLTIINQSIYCLENKLSSRQIDTSRILDMMKESIRRADNIVQSLLDFSRMTNLVLQPEDINTILEDSYQLAKYGLSCEQHIELIKETQQDMVKVLVDENRIKQVFINIFSNAIQAMPEGGRIIIRTQETQLKEIKNGVGRRSGDHFRLGERAVVVEIEDTGVGISEENLKKIFDPFFTTKGPGEGVGLGLSIIRNLIGMHKGLIDLKSQKGKGTRVTITLKAAEETDAEKE
ncbi:MAG: PAS domain S-box protein [bacterium]